MNIYIVFIDTLMDIHATSILSCSEFSKINMSIQFLFDIGLRVLWLNNNEV